MSESKKEGPWNETFEGLAHLGVDVDDAIRLATAQNAEVLKDTIVGHFENQDLGWAGLSPKYAATKAAQGLSNQTLIATATLMNSITIELSPDGLEAKVGVNRKGGGGKSGEDAVLVGAVMEYGSGARNIPARPFLKPSFEEKQEDMRDRYRKKINQALQSAASKMGAQATDG